MRSAFKEINQDEEGNVDPELLDRINPDVPVDLVIDHSIQVDSYGEDSAIDDNVELEFKRNKERYQFLNWAQSLLIIFLLFLHQLVLSIKLTLNT